MTLEQRASRATSRRAGSRRRARPDRGRRRKRILLVVVAVAVLGLAAAALAVALARTASSVTRIRDGISDSLRNHVGRPQVRVQDAALSGLRAARSEIRDVQGPQQGEQLEDDRLAHVDRSDPVRAGGGRAPRAAWQETSRRAFGTRCTRRVWHEDAGTHRLLSSLISLADQVWQFRLPCCSPPRAVVRRAPAALVAHCAPPYLVLG